jgi:hypothetical protein
MGRVQRGVRTMKLRSSMPAACIHQSEWLKLVIVQFCRLGSNEG